MPGDRPDYSVDASSDKATELESGFSVPWSFETSVVIAAGASQSYTITIVDDSHIYTPSSLNVCSSGLVAVSAAFTFNGKVYGYGVGSAMVIIDLRNNPPINACTDDVMILQVFNNDTSSRTITTKFTGVKVAKPLGWGHPPTASFTATPLEGEAPLEVQFTDVVEYAPDTYEWDKDGLGYVDAGHNPLLTYLEVGIFSPKLKVSNIFGHDIYSRLSYITVTPPSPPGAPVAIFEGVPRSGSSPLDVQFTDLSTGAPTSWEWSAQSIGVFSALQNPAHQFTVDGSYWIQLKCSSTYGEDTARYDAYISVASYENLSAYTEVDVPGRLTVATPKVTFAGLLKSDNAYLYKDKGVDAINGFTIKCNVKITSMDNGNSTFACCLCNGIGAAPSLDSYSTVIELTRSGTDYYFSLALYLSSSRLEASWIGISVNVDYWIKLVRVANSNSIDIYVYSDSSFSTLVATRTMTSSHLTNYKFRYLQAVSSLNGTGSLAANGYVNQISYTT